MTTRRDFLKMTLAGATIASMCRLVVGEEQKNSRPNVIIILADDLGWGDPGCYPKGKSWGAEAFVPTPHIDRLAAEGVRCTDGYATGMVCAPSRAGLLTGRYQQKFGFYGFVETNVGIPRQIKLLSDSLRAAGYATGMFGKWHVGYPPGFKPLDRGFERFFGFLGGQHDYFEANIGQPIDTVDNAPDAFLFDQDAPVKETAYLTDELTDRALKFMSEAHAARRPFLVYLPYNAPHPPMQARWDDLEPYAAARADGKFVSRDIARAMIQRLDVNIGRVMEFLKAQGIKDDTLVIFTSDNGGHDDGPGHCVQHNGGLRGRKGYYFEGGIRVPFIISWPGQVPAGLVYCQPVSQLDIYPTVLAAVGVPEAENRTQLDGVDLLPFLKNARKDPPHGRLFWSLEKTDVKWAVREGRWKLVNDDLTPTSEKRESKPEFRTQLFDLEADPFEQHDLAESKPERVNALRQAMADFHALMKPTLYTSEQAAIHGAAMDERAKDPSLNSLPRIDGAPGHWTGFGTKSGK